MLQDAYNMKAMEAVQKKAAQLKQPLGAEKFIDPTTFCARCRRARFDQYVQDPMHAGLEWCDLSAKRSREVYDNMVLQMELLGGALSWGDGPGEGVRLILGSDAMDKPAKIDNDQLRSADKKKADLTSTWIDTKWLVPASVAAFDPNCSTSDVKTAMSQGCSVIGRSYSCGSGCGLDSQQEAIWQKLDSPLDYPIEMWRPSTYDVWRDLRGMLAGIQSSQTGPDADVMALFERRSVSGAMSMSGMTDRPYWVSCMCFQPFGAQ